MLLGDKGQRDRETRTGLQCTYNLGTNLGVQCTVYLSKELGQTVNYQLIVIKETKGYVCDETRQSIDGSPELFRVVDQQRYEKASK